MTLSVHTFIDSDVLDTRYPYEPTPKPEEPEVSFAFEDRTVSNHVVDIQKWHDI